MLFSLAFAVEPVLWVDPIERFPATERLVMKLVNPTTAHAVLLLDGVAVAEVPPRGLVRLSLPVGAIRQAWRTPEGAVLPQAPLVLTLAVP